MPTGALRTWLGACAMLVMVSSAQPARCVAKLTVITTTPDLAAIAREVGGDKVDAESLALGTQDPHFVDPKPSFIVKLNRADLYVKRGLELEIGWAPVLEKGARILPELMAEEVTAVYAGLRLMGKRQLGQMTVFDLVRKTYLRIEEPVVRLR